MADLVKTVMLKVVGDSSSAEDALDRVYARAEELKATFPELSWKIDSAKALAEAAILKAEMTRVIADDPIVVPVKPDVPSLVWTDLKQKLRQDLIDVFTGNAGGGGGITGFLFGGGPLKFSGGGGGIGGFFSSLFSNAGQFGAVGIGGLLAGLMGVVNVVGGLVAGLAAAGQALGAFGALAYPEFSTLLTAIGAGKAGLKGLNDQQAAIVTGALNIENEYKRLAANLAPSVDKILAIFTMKGGIGSQILQDLPAFANAAAPAIEKLLTQFNKWLSSPGAQQFQNMMVKLAPGVIMAIGNGIGSLAIAIGKLIEVFSHGNTAADVITGIFRALTMLVNALTWFITQWNQAWDSAWRAAQKFRTQVLDVFVRVVSDISNWSLNIGQWLAKVGGWFQDLPGQIATALGKLGPQLFSIGLNAMTSFLNGLRSVPVVGTIISWVGSGVAAAKHALGISSPSTVFAEIGRNTAEGFRIGLTQQATGFGINVTNTTGGAGGGMTALVLQFEPTGDPVIDAIGKGLRAFVQKTGGGGPNSVQHAFGRA